MAVAEGDFIRFFWYNDISPVLNQHWRRAERAERAEKAAFAGLLERPSGQIVTFENWG